MRLCCCLCIPPNVAKQRLCKSPLIVARQRLGKNPPIVARPLLGKNPFIVARQRLGRNVTAVTNTLAAIEELLDAWFQCGPCYIKESRRLVLPRTSCRFINYWHSKSKHAREKYNSDCEGNDMEISKLHTDLSDNVCAVNCMAELCNFNFPLAYGQIPPQALIRLDRPAPTFAPVQLEVCNAASYLSDLRTLRHYRY
jgi:hypothetical protein